MKKQFFTYMINYFLLLGIHPIKTLQENLNLQDSSFDELKKGYVGVYNQETKTVRCTKASPTSENEEKIFYPVKQINCCDECKGTIIGTCKNQKYDPTKKVCDNPEAPFFFIITEQ